MCGIAGYHGSFSRAQLIRGSHLQAHRGPDANAEWFDDSAGVGLAHRRLSIIDLSPAGAQPMRCTETGSVIVFNGEIYNFRELRKELHAEGFKFRGMSDTEVLLALYVRDGEAMLPRLNGIFAFAVWDPRKRAMLLARDAMGVKPLYYARLDQGVAFASEIKALRPLIGNDTDLDIAALYLYMKHLWCPGEATPFSSVRKLLPGEAMWIQQGALSRKWAWYRLPLARMDTIDGTAAEVAHDVASSLRTAVHRQLVADVSVGAFLSGGLDSSAVVAFAREENPGIRCFTIETTGWEEEGFADDLPFARQAAAHLGVRLDAIRVDGHRVADDIEAMVRQLDEPLADPAALNVRYISQLARDNGIKVLLSGAGGDDLYGGYRRHSAIRLQRHFDWIPRPLAESAAAVASSLDQRVPLFRRVSKAAGQLGQDRLARVAGYFNWADEALVTSLLAEPHRDALRGALDDDPLCAYLKALPDDMSDLGRMLALEQRFFLPDHNLCYTDKMSMATGVEVRVPFLDLELVAQAARIPDGMKQRGGEGKWILKRAMEPYLPRNIIYRPKTGFGAPVRRWMRHELRPLMYDSLSSETLARRGLFEPSAVGKLIERNDAGSVDAAYTLLSMMTIEIWCKQFLDREPQPLSTDSLT
jgi:asparagine synthase (glutamine-hydrolysing)